MRPTKLKILGKEYKVFYIPRLEDVNNIPTPESLFGYIDYVKGEIRIFGGLAKYDAIQVLLHEALHGIATALCIGVDEKQVDLLATGLANVMIDNKLIDDGKFS